MHPRWIDGSASIPGFWIHGQQCDVCDAADKREERRAKAIEVMRSSGLPPRYQGYSFRHTERMADDEQLQDFAARLEASERKILGVTRHNGRLVRELSRWAPSDGSLYLQGPVGTGKTTITAALVAAAIRADKAPLYTTESDLFSARRWEMRHRSTKVRSMLDACRGADVLFLDDLGRIEDLKPWMIDDVESVICYRYDHELPVVISSNLDMSALAPLYGDRVVSRLFQLVRGRQKELAGYDWRTGVEHELADDDEPEAEHSPDYRERAAGRDH